MLGVVVHAADVSFELLIAVLQLFDHARELPDLRFQPVKAQHDIGTG